MKRWIGAIAVVMAIAIGFGVYRSVRGPAIIPENDPADSSTKTVAELNTPDSLPEPTIVLTDMERLATLRLALAETENINPEAAEPLWDKLLQERPQDLDTLQNWTLNRLSQLRLVSEKLNQSNLSPDELAQARDSLPGIKLATEQALARFEATLDSVSSPNTGSGDNTAAAIEKRREIVAWSRAYANYFAANSLSFDDRREAIARSLDQLIAFLKSHPSCSIVVGAIQDFEESSSQLDGRSPAELKTFADVLIPAADANPNNIYIAMYALRMAIAAKDPRALGLAERAIKKTLPLGPEASASAGMEMSEIAAALQSSLSSDDWESAGFSYSSWFNVFNATQAVKTDRRRASVNLLDLVATQSINELGARIAAENLPPASSSTLQFSVPQLVDCSISNLLALDLVDADLLGTPELVVANDHQVAIMKWDGNGWIEFAARELDPGIRGIIATDLFVVDGHDEGRIERVNELSKDGNREAASESFDKDHDTFPCLVAWGEQGIQTLRVDGRPNAPVADRILPEVESNGLQSIQDVAALIAGDIDADGDLDLFVSTESQGFQIWINRGNMTFFSLTEFSSVPAANDPVISMSIGDLDRDLDLDVVTVQRSGTVGWLENLLHMQMRWAPLPNLPNIGTTTSASLVEWDGNVSWDVVYGGSEKVGLWRTETTDAGVFTVIDNSVRELPTSGNTANAAMITADLDNDSWMDVLLSSDRGVQVLRGGPQPFQELPLESLSDQATSHLNAIDFNQDGKNDLTFLQNGKLFYQQNKVENIGHYLDVQMIGIDDNASGRVNHYAIGSTLELRFGPHYRAFVVNDRSTRFGLGDKLTADAMRAILTNGITQNVINPPVDTRIVEQQTLKGSCPFLYAWNGERFEFVTDCLWAAPLGLQYALGKVIPDRPWEYLKVDGRFLKPKDGNYEIRLTEELWELAYFDHVSLIAVDHPQGVDIWTNEKVGPPNVVQPQTFAFNNAREITHAVDTKGNDCTEILAKKDERYVQGFDRRIVQGLCPPHWIDLQLGDIDADDKIYLLLTGWIFPTDTSLNIQIDQNPELSGVEPPSVWIPDSTGNWFQSIEAMGFPGGKTKTIVVELTGKINAEDPRVRIRTTAQIYWDAAQLVVNPPQVDSVTQTLQMISAEVSYRGFSALLPRNSTQPHRFDYDSVDRNPKWPPLRGNLTVRGPCDELLGAWDDSMVVLGAGDEIQLKFRVPDLPIPDGWERDFILHSVGWDKDADLNTLAGQSVNPLPFRQMSEYPPPARQADEIRKVEKLNAHHLKREQSFRAFWAR